MEEPKMQFPGHQFPQALQARMMLRKTVVANPFVEPALGAGGKAPSRSSHTRRKQEVILPMVVAAVCSKVVREPGFCWRISVCECTWGLYSPE
jgi:hypothetical protein